MPPPSLGYLIPHLWRSLWRKPITVSFPFGPLQLSPSYRGRVALDVAACRACGLCARDCPASALVVERQGRRGVRITHYYDRCANCGQCELSCPTQAIRLQPDFTPGGTSRDSLHVVWSREDAGS
jgi:hydrogenase-4 component H